MLKVYDSATARAFGVVGHGAGAGQNSPFMVRFAEGMAARGVTTATFDFPYMVNRRSAPDKAPVLEASWREAVEQARKLAAKLPLFIGGKSMGGRIASMVADEVFARGLVCLGYPFHPPGAPAKLRTAHLETLRTPTLIVQGTRDAFGSREEIETYRLSPAIRIAYLEGGDHSFKPPARSGRTEAENLEEAIARVGDFVQGG